MAHIKTEDSKVSVVEGGQAATAGNVILLIIGSIMTIAGFVKLSAAEWSLTPPFLFGLLFLLFGLIALLGLLHRASTNEKYSLTIEGDSVIFSREGRNIKFARQDFTSIEIQYDPSGRAKHPVYSLFLRRADGSHFWLMRSGSPAAFLPWIQALAPALQCPAFNASGREFPEWKDLPVAGPFVPGAAHPVEFERTKPWAKLAQGKTGELLVLEDPVSWTGRAILTLAGFLFLGIPTGFIYYAAAGNGPSAVPLGAVPFLGIFVFLAGVIFIAVTKRFEVEVRMDQVRAKISLGPGFLSKLLPQFFTRERIIPRAEIQQVRVDRLVEGNYRLVLIRRDSPGRPAPLIDRIYFRIGIYPAPDRNPPDSGDAVELWEVPGWNNVANGPVLEDLLFLEKHLQDRLRIE